MAGLEQLILTDGDIDMSSLEHHPRRRDCGPDHLGIRAAASSDASATVGPFEICHNPGEGNEKERVKQRIRELDMEMGMSSLKHHLPHRPAEHW